ncbi:hypothetical protein WJX77_012164 [Trebouxia sp. C0004]
MYGLGVWDPPLEAVFGAATDTLETTVGVTKSLGILRTMSWWVMSLNGFLVKFILLLGLAWRSRMHDKDVWPCSTKNKRQ